MKQIMKKALSLMLVLAMVFTLTPMVASAAEDGSRENPYQLFPENEHFYVMVGPEETVYIQASAVNGTVQVDYSTTTDWFIQYDGLTQVFPAEDGTATLVLEGYDMFSVYNRSATESVSVYMAFTAEDAGDTTGTMENPEEVVLEENPRTGALGAYVEAELVAGSEGYYYVCIAPGNGKLFVNVGAYDAEYNSVDWMYVVNNETSAKYGDYHFSDEDSMYQEACEVSEGDRVVIFVNTYNPEDMWFNPAGIVNVNIGFAAVGSQANPEEITDGDYSTEIAEGSQGHYYRYTATEAGTVTITMISENGWTYVVNNLVTGNYGDMHWSDDDPLVTTETWTVAEGDVLDIVLNTFDPENPWAAPAGTVDWTLTFEVEAVEEECPCENIVHMEAVEPGCHYEGNAEYWYCADCYTVWVNEELTQISNFLSVILPEVGGEVIHMEAVEPGCHYDGNIEYWYCAECEQVWQDEALTQLTNIKNVVLPSTSKNVIHVDAVAPTCWEEGNIEYWYCVECEQFWQDEALTQLTNIKNVILPAACQEVIHVEAIEPACHYDGNIEYWYCADCEQVWQNEALTQLTNIKNVILPEVGGEVVHFEAVEPGCHNLGCIEYWYCAECEQFWQDEALTQLTNSKNVVLPAVGGEVVHFEAVEAGCHSLGNIEYWYCADCEGFWQDEALTQLTNSKNVILPETGAELIHFEAVAPNCHMNGNIEYWYCPDCEAYWQDEALTQLTNSKNVILPALGEDILTDGDAEKELVVHVEAIEAGCHSLGNIEYWYCTECDQVWQDEALTQLTNSKNVILPATGSENVEYVEAVEARCHSLGNVEYWYCADCETYYADEACTIVTNAMNVIVPAVGTENVEYFEAIEPGCHYNGNIEYWYCADCETYYADEACTIVTNAMNVIVPAVGTENVEYFEAIEPGCHYDGNIEYWYCAECEQVWQDAALTQLTNIKNVVLPATGEETIHFEAIEPGCHYDGNIEYWYCADCEQVWQDEALTQLTNIKNVVLPAVGGEVNHVEAVAPTAGVEGNIEYWWCEECEQFWQDEALTQLTNSKNVILPALESGVSLDGFQTEVEDVTEEIYNNAVEVMGDVVAENKFAVIEINLYNEATGEQVHVPGEVVTVTIPVPAGLELGEGQVYVVYRINDDGSYTKCVTTYVDGVIAFETDHFSTFVVVVEDAVVTPDDGTTTPDDETTTPDDGNVDGVVGTGDNANMVLWISILGLGLVAVAGSVVMKKEHSN